MPKNIPVSNGSLLVNFDLDYQIRDIYYPNIGQENHSFGQSFQFGVWIDEQFSWIGPEWEKDLIYCDDTLVTDVTLKNKTLGLKIHCHDIVDVNLNVYIKKIKVFNLEPTQRQVKLFFRQHFYIYGNNVGGTAYFDPRTKSIIHYKVKRYFLINCSKNEQSGVEQYSCQNHGDIEDLEIQKGELNGNPSSWGATNSTIGMSLDLPADGSKIAYYWIAVGKKQDEVANLNLSVQTETPEKLINRSKKYWKTWLLNESIQLKGVSQKTVDIFNRSLLIIRTQIDNNGAIIAANDSDIIRFGQDTYSYMWGRDGAFVSAALAEAGYSHICMKFFDFCSRILSDEGYLFQHYNPDGSLASNWHSWIVEGKEVLPIQEDSTALIIWSLWIHYQKIKDIEFIRPLYDTLIKKSANFLLLHRDHETLLPLPSYDLWEEHYAVHTYTVSSVIAGLRSAANFAELFQEISLAKKYNKAANAMIDGIKKYFYHTGLKRYARSGTRTNNGYKLNEVIDISLLSLGTMGILKPKDSRMVRTVNAVREQLWVNTPIGGCARYKNDYYQRDEKIPKDIAGNPWFISTLWLGEYFIDCAENLEELQLALPYFKWCEDNALKSGVLAEQIHPISGEPFCVSPLTWSHSAFVWTVFKYSEKYKLFKKK